MRRVARHYWILLIVSALPLLIYPFVLLANIMSLAAPRSSTPVPMMQWVMANAFLWSSTLYPIVYLACLIAAIVCAKQGDMPKAMVLSAASLAYVGLCIVLMIGWMMTG